MAINDKILTLPRLIANAPWWLLLAVGGLAIALGAALLLRPLSSISVLVVYIGLCLLVSGIADLLSARSSGSPRVFFTTGALWILAGVLVLLQFATAITVLPVFLAVALIASGVLGFTGVFRGSVDQRAAAVLFALADITFGVLALAWPDVTLLIVAVLFGARTIAFGIRSVWSAFLSARTGRASASTPPRRAVRWVRLVGAIGALVLAVLASGLAWTFQPGTARADAFYTAPADVPEQPGQLLRVEPFDTAVPDRATGWRILYTTTLDDEQPAVASAIIVTGDAASTEPRGAIVWAHGTTGYATDCAPSLLDDPFGAGALPELERILDEGWVLVATDYPGLGTAGPQPYLIGQGEGRSVLDAARAAQQMEEITLSGQTALWGHSQGGHASLWAGQLAPLYAPELDVVGVVSLAPASDVIALVRHLPTVTGGSVFASFVAQAYFDSYPELLASEHIAPQAQTLVREMASRCLSSPGALVSVLAALSIDGDISIFRSDPATGALGERLEQNTPRGEIAAPLFVGQGGADPLVDPAMQRAYLAGRCAEGLELEYREYPGFDHMGVIGPDSPLLDDLFGWTHARFAGAEFTPNCSELGAVGADTGR